MTAVFDYTVLIAALGDAARRFDIDILADCPSTNGELLTRAEAGAASGTVVVAERQSAGRGRRGRQWHAAPGDSLTFSLLWRLPAQRQPAGLSLAVGVAVARAIAKLGAGEAAPEVKLKWPNDVLLGGGKLGGILVELVPGAPQSAVIGIGLNVRLPAEMPDDVRAAAAALASAGAAVDANQVLAALLRELRETLTRFSAAGFAALRTDWLGYHAYQDAPIRLLGDFAAPREGICRGVDADGALLFESAGSVERVLSGEISLRPA